MTPVCHVDRIDVEGGVAALVDGEAVAVFRTHDGGVFALDNLDPFSWASVLSRGIVGSRNGTPYVASPIGKQGFDLRTGECLDAPGVRVATYDVHVRADGVVVVGDRRQ